MSNFAQMVALQEEMQKMQWEMSQLVHFLGLVLSVTGPVEVDHRQAELFKASGLEPDFDLEQDESKVTFRLVASDGQ